MEPLDTVLHTRVNYGDEYYRMFGDPRMDNWLFMNTPIYSVIFSGLYLVFVFVLGPSWMKKRQPYNVKYPMIIYNLGLVFLSGLMTVRYLIYGWLTTYSWRCEPIDFSENPLAVKIAANGWFFHTSKLVELLDTVFFVLRKKDSQITPLHVFHHALVPITSWYGVRYGSGGYNTIFPLANFFVHTWMYLYYGLAAMGPSVQRFLWWKKYLTILQLIQFNVVFFFMLQLYVFPVESCKVNPFLVWLTLIQAVVFLVLFVNFYLSSYSKKKLKKDLNSSNEKTKIQ